MKPNETLHPGSKRPIRIIVADHRIVRDCLRVLLTAESDMEVIAEAATGQEVLRQSRELLPDIVIMDVSMPELNSMETTRQLLSSAPGVKVIALAIHADSPVVRDMFRSGASGYLLKKCSVEELIKAVRTVANKKTYLSPGISDIVIRDFLIWGHGNNHSAFSFLTSREREVLQLMTEGKTTKKIAGCLYVSIKTVESHRTQLMNKLGIHSLAGLTKYAIRQGLTAG